MLLGPYSHRIPKQLVTMGTVYLPQIPRKVLEKCGNKEFIASRKYSLKKQKDSHDKPAVPYPALLLHILLLLVLSVWVPGPVPDRVQSLLHADFTAGISELI